MHTIVNLRATYQNQGEHQRAREYYQLASRICANSNEEVGEAFAVAIINLTRLEGQEQRTVEEQGTEANPKRTIRFLYFLHIIISVALYYWL